MKRGWILLFSVLLLGVIITGVWSLRFIPVGLFWRILMWGTIPPIIFFLLIYFWWAPRNLFFTFVPEGRAKIVVKGDAVDSRSTLLQWQGHEIFTGEPVIAPPLAPGVPLPPPPPTAVFGDIVPSATPPRRIFGGLRWYGFWPIKDIYVYTFGWTNITHDGQIQAHSTRPVDYILVKDDVYWAKVVAAEDQKLLPLDVGLVLRLRAVNPYKALFKVENWLETVINLVEPSVRYVLSTDTYENWIRLPQDLGDKVFNRLQGIGGGTNLVAQLRDQYGIEMVSLGVKSFDPTPLANLDEGRRATLKQYFAEKEAVRITTEAEARKTEAELLGQGAAAAIHAVQNLGSEAMQLRALELIAKGGNANFVLPASGPAPSLIIPPPPPHPAPSPPPAPPGPPHPAP